MASKAYKQSVDLKKKMQAQKVWEEIGNDEQLSSLTHLHKKIQAVGQKRSENRGEMKKCQQEYKGLQKGIKDFIKSQTVEHKRK